MNPLYEQAMREPIRRLDVGGNQGKGNPPATRYHHAAPDADEGRGLLGSSEFWILGCCCLLVWFGLYVALTQ